VAAIPLILLGAGAMLLLRNPGAGDSLDGEGSDRRQ
jgi:hypothetical protein